MKHKRKINKRHNSHNRPVKNQVRIIGGRFKRSNVTFIDIDGLRPTPDRMRETLFNWLMNDINGAKVLDAFAGSGVLGFEALSRGAASVTFIETNSKQYQALLSTSNHLNLSSEQAIIQHGDAGKIIPMLSEAEINKSYDLIFLDPPYSLNLWQPIISLLQKQHLLTNKTIIYIEANQPLSQIFNDDTFRQLTILKEKKVGQVNSWLVQANINAQP